MRGFLTVTLLAMGLLSAVGEARERELGAPVYDSEAETTHRQVSWRDFKGEGTKPPGWSRWEKGSFAHIATGLRLGAWEVATRQEAGGWIAVPVGIRPYAVMDKYQSAVRPASRTPEVLAHEQLHFDLSEAEARRLARELAAIAGRGATEEAAREDLDQLLRARFEQGVEELVALQRSYDGDTRNGSHKKQQKTWAARIEERFREATDALAELLGDG